MYIFYYIIYGKRGIFTYPAILLPPDYSLFIRQKVTIASLY